MKVLAGGRSVEPALARADYAEPASHGCVRIPAPEAKGLYKFAALGTAVVVF
jgi:lipoprotein-anchoring transpeptidase ErfK/SrfK